MLRPRSLSGTLANRVLLARMRPIVAAPPFWGARRVWDWEGLPVKKQRIERLMREASCSDNRARPTATRTPQAKPKATRPRQYWGIDMMSLQSAGA